MLLWCRFFISGLISSFQAEVFYDFGMLKFMYLTLDEPVEVPLTLLNWVLDIMGLNCNE